MNTKFFFCIAKFTAVLLNFTAHIDNSNKGTFCVSRGVCVCVCVYYIFVLLIAFFVCVFVIPFLPSVKVKHQSFSQQTCQLSDAVAFCQPTNSTFGDSLCRNLAYNLHTAGCPSVPPSVSVNRITFQSRVSPLFRTCHVLSPTLQLQNFVLPPSSSTPSKLLIFLSILSAFAKFHKSNISVAMFGCPSLCPSAHTEQLGYHLTDFQEI